MSHTPTPWKYDIAPDSQNAMLMEEDESVIVGLVAVHNIEADTQFIVRAVNAHDELVAALRLMRERYGRLHDALSDCIESGRLKRGEIDDDYQALVDLAAACVGADHTADELLKRIAD